MTWKALTVAALTLAGLLGAVTAWACHRARKQGRFGADAPVWAILALVYVGMAQTKVARVLGWLKGLGAWLRLVAQDLGVYSGRRPFQIVASLAVAVITLVVFTVGVVSLWNYIKRYRMAVGFTGLAVGYALVRFISLHELDAWNTALPWLAPTIELVAAAGGSAIALLRLRQLGRAQGRAESGARAAAEPVSGELP